MLFTSIAFLYYFLPLTIIIYFIVPKKCKNIILLIASLLFYFYGEPKYIFLMILEIVVAYVGSLLIEKYNSKNILICTLFVHVFLLFIFKYANFLLLNINNFFGADIKFINIALPIGISFYTFQIISYVVDVYRKKVKAQHNIIKLATYVSLFPQLIAGPIVRYETIEKELDDRSTSFYDFAYGIRRFVVGFAKKILIANVLGELCSKFGLIGERSVLFYWLFAIGYMLQIYFDFSAYSDMAIGLGRIFGFHFLENFNYPYISTSITEFWRRWHISLGSWFKDYVYIPLGGSRKGKWKLIRNLLIVWLLTGIWHGASWNFVLWGIIFGILLILEKLWYGKYLEKLPKFLRSFYVLFVVMISFIIFSSSSLKVAWNNVIGLFGFNGELFVNKYTIYCFKSYFIVLAVSFIAATPVMKNIVSKLRKNSFINKCINFLEPIFIVILLILCTACLIDNSYNPFLYFRF